jgi:hypothetical protein
MSFYSNSGASSDYSRLDDVRVLYADRQPCIVCGHPTGDCTNSDQEKLTSVVGIQGKGELFDKQKIYVEDDVVMEVQLTSFTKGRVIVAKKGSYVTVEQAKELGII